MKNEIELDDEQYNEMCAIVEKMKDEDYLIKEKSMVLEAF